MKILIVEDDVVIVESIRLTLEDFGYKEICHAASFAQAFIKLEADNPDLVILDVTLNGRKNGIDIANLLNITKNIPFIFLTGCTEREILFQVQLSNPYAILIKPLNPDELYATINLALYKHNMLREQRVKQQRSDTDRIFVKENDNSGYTSLEYKHIKYIQSDTSYIKIHTIYNEVFSMRSSLGDFYHRLDNSFIRVHRSYIVNINYINRINTTHINLDNKFIPLGQKYKDQVFSTLNIH